MPGTEGSWYGVKVSTGHVRFLSLSNNNLNGSIPSQLSKLSHLDELFLSNNQLRGNIPYTLGNMYLVFLDLSYNQLSGNIPYQLGNHDWLEELWLNNNQLSGSIPSQLGNLWDLVTLDLSHNQLSGIIPSSFTNLIFMYTLDIGYNCLSATDPTLRAWLDSHDPDWEAHQDQCGIGTPVIGLTPGTFHFGGTQNGYKTDSQVLLVSNKGSGPLNWKVSTDLNRCSCTPTSGVGNGTVTVSVDPTGLAAGTYIGTIVVTDPNAANSPQTATVILNVYNSNQSSVPFGDFETPIDGSKVSSSIAVTGWVLDDIGVESVKIYRTEGKNKVYIGDAVFVQGARPDVEQAYPTYPNNYKAGWGYMMLTNFLPNNGNGTFTILAIAADMEGNQVTLGTKTILVDNANAVKPFGAIDTPTQGGTATGGNYRNWGWVLTPQPNMIPTDGSTINVWVDGVKLGHPTYNIYRSDIASLFPGYANSNGAAGYYEIDTTSYYNGVHTIQWTAADSGGNTDGIGSRYFTIQNTGSSQSSSTAMKKTFVPGYKDLIDIPISYDEPVKLKKGYTDIYWSEDLFPGIDGITHIQCKELERIMIQVSRAGIEVEGYMMVGNRLMSLPVGSTFEKMGGRFSWIPGPGFLGTYRLIFIETNQYGKKTRKNIRVTIVPKFSSE
ncbi:MAG: hypothetical protein JSV88_23125, partial [Candidatus Aminicenantes bacterium]